MSNVIASSKSDKKILIVILICCTIIAYGFSVPTFFKSSTRFSASNDFSSHAHLMFRFAESFKAGQIIPRTVVSPVQFSDATQPTIDVPTFQYYGFFEGLLALPFKLLKMSDATAAILTVIMVRILSTLILFETCLLLGATYPSAFLATLSFLISPYLLTAFYGRGAVAEVCAQSILTLIPFGFALSYRNQTRFAIVAFALAFLLLPLCHNIFFLYGLLFLAFLILFSFQRKIFYAGIVGTTLGLLMSAWQWYPAHQSIKDIVIFGALNSWRLGIGGVECASASLNGAFGILHPFQPAGMADALPLYFTIGWWVLPAVLWVFLSIINPKKRSLALPFAISSIIFLCLTFQPINQILFEHAVPQLFGIVQTTSRLLSFVSLLGALCLAMAIPKTSNRVFMLLLVLMVVSQWPVFACFLHTSKQQSWEDERTRGAQINYYYSNPANAGVLKNADGTLLTDNHFFMPHARPFFVRLTGIAGDQHQSTTLAIYALNKRLDKYELDSPMTKPIRIEGNFSKTISVPSISASGWYRIILSQKTSAPVIAFTGVDIIPGNLSGWIFQENLDYRQQMRGYTQRFRVKNPEQFRPDQAGYFFIELPVAYSKLFTVEQNNNLLSARPDFNHRLVVSTKDLAHPIFVRYRLDYFSVLLTVVGMAGFGFVLYRHK